MEDLGSNFRASKYDILTTEPEVAVLAVLYEVEVHEELGHVDAAEDVLGVAHDVPEEGGDEYTVPQKVPSEANPKVCNHGEGPY